MQCHDSFFLTCVVQLTLTGRQLPGHPFGQVVPITFAHDVTVCKWLPTPGPQWERSAPAVATNTSAITSTTKML